MSSYPGAARVLRALHDLPRRGLVAAVLVYRFALKPWLGNACRFEPTCSAYALEALRRARPQGPALARALRESGLASLRGEAGYDSLVAISAGKRPLSPPSRGTGRR